MEALSAILSFVQQYNDTRFWNAYFLLQNKKINSLRKMIILLCVYRVQAAHSCDLMVHYSQRGAWFADKPVLPHGLNGIVISNKARIGKNAVIHQQVTIGLRYPGGEAPVIGDNVFIGAGAKILGGIKVGDGAVVGANAVVLDDIPPDCVAVGVPARIAKHISDRDVYKIV